MTKAERLLKKALSLQKTPNRFNNIEFVTAACKYLDALEQQLRRDRKYNIVADNIVELINLGVKQMAFWDNYKRLTSKEWKTK